MKNFRKKIIRVLIVMMLLDILHESTQQINLNLNLINLAPLDVPEGFADLSTIGQTVVAADNDYGSLFSTDPEIIRRINYATSQYLPGTYFTKNGRACTCHGKKINHVNSPSNCNCLRYVKINGSTVDLQAVQCFGYAMYMQMCILGTTQFKSAGSFNWIYGNGNKAMSALEMERFFVEHASEIHPGTHMRCKYAGHSISIMAIDYENGKVTYIDCNNIGPCQIRNFTTLTWAEFASKFATINYITVYKNYYSIYAGAPDADKIAQIQQRLPKPTPSKKPATPTPTPSPADYAIGLYKVNAKPYLYLREDTYTYSKKISELPDNMEVEIFEFAYNKGGHHWGMIDTEAGSGWSSMGYLTLVQEYTPTPTPTYVPADYETGTYKVTASSLMVREKQSTNSASLGKLANSTMVDMMVFVVGDNGTRWGFVSVEDAKLQGWVSMDYMELIPSNTPIPTNTPTATPSPLPTTKPNDSETIISPTEALPTNTPTPTEAIPNEKNEGDNKTAVVITVIALCIIAEGVLFVYMRNRRNRKWVKDKLKSRAERISREVKSKVNKDNKASTDNKKKKSKK